MLEGTLELSMALSRKISQISHCTFSLKTLEKEENTKPLHVERIVKIRAQIHEVVEKQESL